MTEYHYLYVYGVDAEAVTETAERLRDRADRKGVEVYDFARLASVPPSELKRVLRGVEPSDGLYNWVLYLTGLDEVREKLYGYTLRLQDQGSMLEVIDLETVSDGAQIHVRTRRATYSSENPPFSYDPALDYYTEPDKQPNNT